MSVSEEFLKPDPLNLIPSCGNNISTFDQEDTYSDIFFVIPGVEKPLCLHRCFLAMASATFTSLFKGETNSFYKFDKETRRLEWIDEKAKNDEAYRGIFIKWLRFCYGENILLNADECPSALAILIQLGMKSQDELKKAIESYMEDPLKEKKETMKRNVEKAVQDIRNKHPNIKSSDVFSVNCQWGDETKALCWLLGKNAIPTKKLEFEGSIPRPTQMAYTTTTDRPFLKNEDFFLKEGFEELKTNTTLVSLDIHLCSFSEDKMKGLMELLKSSKSLTDLSLTYIDFLGDALKILTAELKTNTTLKSLDISFCKSNDEGLLLVTDLIRVNSTLSKLNLSCSFLRGKGQIPVSEALKVNKTLTELNLSRNALGMEGVRILSVGLKVNTTLKILDLSNNRIMEGTRFISDVLKVNSSLTSLNLGSNGLGPKGFTTLGEGLINNKSLNNLILSWNRIGDEGVKMICNALKGNTSLKSLDLSFNEIGPVGARYFAELRGTNKTLTAVYLTKFDPKQKRVMQQPEECSIM